MLISLRYSSDYTADSTHQIVGSRLKDIAIREQEAEVPSSAPSDIRQKHHLLGNFHHFTTPTLPHLLALLAHTSPSFPPPQTSLLVVDAISSLFALAFPKTVDSKRGKNVPNRANDAAQWAASRKWAVMGDFIGKIGKLAATRNIAILLTMQTATRVYAETETCLYPALMGTAWDSGINARIVLFRDWLCGSTASSSQEKSEAGSRYAAVVKAVGASHEGLGKAVPFKITKVFKYVYSYNINPDSNRMASPK